MRPFVRGKREAKKCGTRMATTGDLAPTNHTYNTSDTDKPIMTMVLIALVEPIKLSMHTQININVQVILINVKL